VAIPKELYKSNHCITLSIKSPDGNGVYLAGLKVFCSIDGKTTGGGGVQSNATADLNKQHILRIHPNPTKNNVTISYSIPQSTNISLKIYDATGRLVKSFSLPASNFSSATSIIWDCSDEANKRLPSGIYFVRLASNDVSTVTKLLILR